MKFSGEAVQIEDLCGEEMKLSNNFFEARTAPVYFHAAPGTTLEFSAR